MKIYNYHPISKEFIGECVADKDPLVAGNYLVPACATAIQPPLREEGHTLVFSTTKNKWLNVIDNRGFEYWVGEEKFTIRFLGEKPPEEFSYQKQEDVPKIEHQWVKSEINKAQINLMYHWTKDTERQSYTEQVWIDYIIALRNYTTVSQNGDIEVTSEVRPVVEDFITKVDDQPDDLVEVEVEDGKVTETDIIIYEELNPPVEEV